MIIHDDFASAWFELLGLLYDVGDLVSPRGFETRELLGVQLRVRDMANNLLVHPKRNLSYRFAVAEWLWMAAGRRDVETVARYNKHIAQFSDDGIVFNGAYGPRVAPQMAYVLEQLRKPFSRQAVVTIWTPNPAPSKDIPCTISWQLFARDGKLHGIVTMRSSDVWLGLPYDFYNFSQLTNGIAGALDLVPGELVFTLGSSHLYERDAAKAGALLDDHASLQCVRSPMLPGRPPADDILDAAAEHERVLNMPWSTYRDALAADTNAGSLAVLEAMI